MAVIELAIGLGRSQGEFKVDVVRSPAGEASGTVNFDSAAVYGRRTELQHAVLASAVSARRVIPEIERPVHAVGEALFAALFGSGQIAERYRASAALAADRQEGLRVVLRIETAELAGLPWEAMFDQQAGTYLCRQEQLVRLVPVPSVSLPLAVDLPLRILGVISDPRGMPALDVDRERDLLDQALGNLVGQGKAEITWVQGATWAKLQDALVAGQWHVLHFIGHGDFDPDRDEGFLALTAEDGRADLVQAHRFTDLLRRARPMPRLVVLNSCSGAVTGTSDLFSGTASALVRGGVSAVTAMQYAISDRAALAFSRGFYTAIAHGRGIDEAVSNGRISILGVSRDTLEWITPVLYLRGDNTQLFDFRAEPPRRAPAPEAPVQPPEPPEAHIGISMPPSRPRVSPAYRARYSPTGARDSYAAERRITMLGGPSSGKTTFLAALNIAAPFDEQEVQWNIIGGDAASSEALSRLTMGLHGRTFPEVTLGIDSYKWRLATSVKRTIRRRWGGVRHEMALVDIVMEINDTSGGLSDPRRSGMSFEEEYIARIARSDGIVYVFDPTGEAEKGNAHAILGNLLAKVAEFRGEARLPHYVAVCVSKFDDPKVLGLANSLGLTGLDYTNGSPAVDWPDARQFFRKLGGTVSQDDTEAIIGTLERYFLKERIEYFVTSAIGFYINPATGKYVADDGQNFVQDDAGPRIRGRVHPINVADAVSWLCLSGSETAGSRKGR